MVFFMKNHTRQTLLTAIAKAQDAVLYYERLADMSPNMQAGKLIKQQIQSEKSKHLQALSTLYKETTGKPAALPESRPDFSTYQDGLRRIILDELETHKFYQQSRDQTQNSRTRREYSSLLASQTRVTAYLMFLNM